MLPETTTLRRIGRPAPAVPRYWRSPPRGARSPLAVEDFHRITSPLGQSLHSLFLPEPTLQRFEELFTECCRHGVSLAASPQAASRGFLHSWAAFKRAVANWFRLTALRRSAEYFACEVSLVKAATRHIANLNQRVALNAEISALEVQLSLFKGSVGRAVPIFQILAQISALLESFSGQSQPVIAAARDALDRLGRSLTEFSSREPKAAEFRNQIESVEANFQPLLSGDLKQFRESTPVRPYRPPARPRAAPPKSAERDRLANLRALIKEQQNLRRPLVQTLFTSLPRRLESDLGAAYSDCFASVQQINEDSQLVINDLNGYLKRSRKLRHIPTISRRFAADLEATAGEVARCRIEVDLLRQERDQIFGDRRQDGTIVGPREFLIFENFAFADEVKAVAAALQSENRFVSGIGHPVESPLRCQLGRLRAELSALSAPVGKIVMPDERRPIDRCRFDPAQAGFDRMKEIQVEYHFADGLLPDDSERLEREYDCLEAQLGGCVDRYESFSKLNRKLTKLRDASDGLIERSVDGTQSLIGAIERKEALETDYSEAIAAVRRSDAGFDFDEELRESLRRHLTERVALAEKLNLVNGWLDTMFPEMRENDPAIGLLARIRLVKRAFGAAKK